MDFGDVFWIRDTKKQTYKGGNEQDLEILEKVKNKKILLDVGGGNGYFADYIKRKYDFEYVYNCEINKTLSQISKKNTNIITLEKDILDFDCKFKFDCILVFNSFEYIRKENYKKLIKRMSSFIARDGVILINFPTKFAKHFKDQSKIRFFRIFLYDTYKYILSSKFKFSTFFKYFLFTFFKPNHLINKYNIIFFKELLKELGFDYEYNKKFIVISKK